MLLGATQEAALAVGRAADPGASRALFESALRYLVLALHEKAVREAGAAPR